MRPHLRDEMLNDILPSLLNDQVKARELEPDGSYVRLHPAEGAARSQAQLHFRERSRQARKAAAELQAQSAGQTDSDQGRSVTERNRA